MEREPAAIIAYCSTRSEHPDNERFMLDCQRWFNRPVMVVSSLEYQDTWHVWEKERYLAGIAGAPCTGALKFAPRLEFQKPTDIHVFRYTADAGDKRRAEAMRASYPEMVVSTPLIDKGITKAGTLAMIQNAGIALPVIVQLGLPQQ